MSILNVNTIQPVGSGQTVTVSATDLKIGSTTLSSGGSGVFVGNLTGNVSGNLTGNVSGNLTGNINSTGVSTVTTLRGSSNSISIPTGHKVVGTDVGSVYAPGSVIKYADNRIPSVNDNYVIIGDGVVYDTPVTITYTPVFATSKLYISCTFPIRIINAFGASSGIKRDGTAINGSYNRSCLSFVYKGDAVNHHYDIHLQTSVNSNSTSATTFTAFFQPYAGTGEFSYGWGNMFIQVWEIAQ